MSDNSPAPNESEDSEQLELLTDAIRQALLDDPLLQDEWLWRLMDDCIDGIPAVLIDMMDLPATITNLVLAKVRVLRHLATSDKYEQVERLPGISIGIKQVLLDLADELERAVPTIDKALALQGKTDAQALIDGPPAAGAVLADMLKEGPVTIAQLLTTQPSMLLLNQ